MALTQSQYQSLIRAYDARKSEAYRIRQKHLDEIRNAIPEYSDLEDEAAGIALNYGRRLITDPNTSISEMDAELAKISSAKEKLLIEHGYDLSYLEPAFTCADCKDTGYINGKKCHCFKLHEIELTYKQSNIHEFFQTENFAHLRTDFYEGEDLEHFLKASEISHSFVDNFDNNYQNLMFYGKVGTGKSFLSGCIAYELLESGHSVIYFSATDLFKLLSDTTFHRGTTEYDDSLSSEIYECDLLVIDDLGTEIGGQFVNSSLFTCLNERQLRHKPIIVSTNLSLAEIHERYSDRVFSRIVGNFTIIKLTGPDLRVKNKDNK